MKNLTLYERLDGLKGSEEKKEFIFLFKPFERVLLNFLYRSHTPAAPGTLLTKYKKYFKKYVQYKILDGGLKNKYPEEYEALKEFFQSQDQVVLGYYSIVLNGADLTTIFNRLEKAKGSNDLTMAFSELDIPIVGFKRIKAYLKRLLDTGVVVSREGEYALDPKFRIFYRDLISKDIIPFDKNVLKRSVPHCER